MRIKIFSVTAFLLLALANSFAWAQDDTYHIGTGDMLEISVWKDDSLSRKVVVPPDGVISFPLIGDIKVTNLNVAGLRKIVTKKLSEFVPDATVTVLLLEINSLKAFVIGKVNNPGVFPISMQTSVMQVLSMAGGLNPFASESRIHILRRQNNTTVKIPFNYKDVSKGENLGQNILLQRGDVVVVP